MSLERVVRSLEAAFSRHRLPIERTYTEPRRAIFGRTLEIAPFVQPVTIYGGTLDTATLTDLLDSNGRLLVNAGTSGVAPQSYGAYLEVSDLPTSNTDAIRTLNDSTSSAKIGSFTGDFEVQSVLYSANVDATVSSRTFLGRYTPAGRVVALGSITVDTSSLTLTASEAGRILRDTEGGNGGTIEVTDDNGTIAVNTGKAPQGHIVTLSESFSAKITANSQAGDRTAVSIFARPIS